MKTKISANNAPKEIGAYSNAIKVGNMVFVSGQLPVNPETGDIPQGIQAQTKQVIENVRNILADAGATLDNVVKTTVFLADLNDFVPMNNVYAGFFHEPYPARSAVQVAKIPKGAPVEIECIAVK